MITANTSTVKITADISQFEREMGRAEHSSMAVNAGLSKLRTAAVAMAGAMAAAAGVTGVGAMVARSMQLQDELAKTADRLGISTQTLKAFQLQADLAGIGADGFDRALEKMTLNLQDAAKGTGTAQDAIKQLGLNVYELASQSPDQAYLQIADAMNHLESETQKVSIAADIFGVKSTAMVNMINEGRAGFDSASQKVTEYGTALSRIDAAKLEAANDAMTRAQEATDGVATRLSLRLAPVLEKMADNWARNTVEAAKFFGLRTEEEELFHLLEKRKNLMDEVGRLQALYGNDGNIQNKLREVEALRVEIREIINRRNEETMAAATKERAAQIEQQATQKRLESAASEEAASKSKKLALDAETAAYMRNLEARRELSEGLQAEESENAAGQQLLMDQRAAGMVDYQNNLRQITALQAEEQAKQLELDRIAADSKQAMQESVAGNAVALMRMLGAKNKNWARAAVILDKAMAIAKIKIATEVAAMNAAAAAAVGGPGAASAAAASMRAMGYASMALVAAMGVMELSNINTGGGGGGSSGGGGTSSPPVGSPYGAPNPVIPTQQSGSITINVNGVITEDIIQRLVVPAIQDAVENRDVILIRGDSRNGQELMV